MACSTKVISCDCPKLRGISTLQTDARFHLPCSLDWLLRSSPNRPARLQLSGLWRIPGRHRRDWRGCAYSLRQIGKRRGGSIGFVGNFLDQLNDGPPQAIIINSRECLQQTIGMWPGELVKNQLFVSVRHLVTAREQGRDWNIQKRCDLQQSPAANPISPLLVFLDLLERQTELISKVCLSEPLLQTINPDIAANHLVDRVGPFASHHNLRPPEQTKTYRTPFPVQ